jgi:integrase
MTRDMRNIYPLPSGHFRVRFEYRSETIDHVVATYEEAVDLRDELKRQILDDGLVPAKGRAPRDLRALFLGSRNGNRSTKDDASRWDKHIAPAPWARKALVSITRSDGNAWLKALKRKRLGFDPELHGARGDAFLGWQTRKHCLNLARAFFTWAIDQECYGITTNPFTGLVVSKEDGDEDAGYQDGWYLDPKEQQGLFSTWDRQGIDLDEGDRMEKWIAMFAVGSGLRRGEMWCLHLEDVHVGLDEPRPRVEVKYGSWDRVKCRYRAPKGRKGEKKNRTVYLHGLALEAARAWLAQLRIYAPKNPLGLMFPTERGARRSGNPRSWTKVAEAFGVIPRIGRKPWWHLLRHTCASSLLSGWWGMRWSLEEVSKVLGHTDVRTTQIYAHLAPSAMQEAAMRAHAAYAMSRHEASTGSLMNARTIAKTGHARYDSNIRHSASKADQNATFADEVARHGASVEAIRHVLELAADGGAALSIPTVRELEKALDAALKAYAAAVAKRRAR